MMLVQIWVLGLHLHLALSISEDVDMPGDVVLGGLLEVQHYVDGSCTDLLSESVQINEAVRWFFRQLNDRNYIPNVKLGFHAFKTCGNAARATGQTIDMMTKYVNGQGPQLFGILGPDYSSETQSVSRLLSSLPEEDRLLQISYSATAAILADKSIYKNLYRVIETDDVQVEVTLKLMQALNWNYVAIVFDSDTYGRDAAYALRASAEADDICIPVFFPLELGQTDTQQKTAFSQLIHRLQVDEESTILGLVFFGRSKTANNLFLYIEGNLDLTNFQMIVSESLALDQINVQDAKGDTIIPRTHGLLTPSPPHYDVALFSQFWADLHTNATLMTNHTTDNDWYLGYLHKITGCHFTEQMDNATSCLNKASEYINRHEKLTLYTHYALRGAAAFAKTMKQLHAEECGANTGLCDQMRSLPKIRAILEMTQTVISTSVDFQQELVNVNITFSFEKGEIRFSNKEAPAYAVYNWKFNGSPFGFYKVGEFRDEQLHITDTIVAYNKAHKETVAVHAQCQPDMDCKKCLKANGDRKVLYIPGDFYIIGMAPIHNKEGNFLKCGSLRSESLSVDLTIAMQFAVSTLNNKSGILGATLGNRTMGLVVLDTCSNPYKIQEQITSLNDGSLRLRHGSNSSKILDKIIAYIGPAFSFVAVPLSTLLTDIQKLQISYSATASSLSNRHNHPYFMRVSSPDHKQAEVIMQLAKTTSSKYIQIIFSNEEYGIAGKEVLLDAARKHEICVAQSIEAQNTVDPTKHTGYISGLRVYRYAKVVIVFALPSLTRLIMENLDKHLESGEFAFIGGESWAQMEALLTSNLQGSLTIAQKLPEITAFAEYFRDIDVQTYPNPWLEEYFEEINQCYLPKSFQKKNRQKCPSTWIGDRIQPDLWTTFGIYTIYSLVRGFDDAVTSICGDVVICPGISAAAMIKKLKEVKLDMYQNGENINVFDDNGDGNVGYTISQIVRKGSLKYEEVGYSSQKRIVLSRPVQELMARLNFTSACPNVDECGKCERQFKSGRINQANPDGIIIFYSLVAGASVLGLIVLVMSGCLCCRCRRVKKTKKKEDPYSTICPRDSFIQ
ncbi:uncharacterized protein LOC124144464 [Haliotis rufescens]|uniref:uncharacterized protein LOC124144464 n=1 Tax=Haliotis rufescens TaxID=6454 RepID=UPI00201ED393|nr:uncharacterized protein LOC124144464 [Haliotis rufescens]